MTNLLINIDHVATLRNARKETFPDPVHAAVLCELAGADGIVFHLREDRRHISTRDVRLLKPSKSARELLELLGLAARPDILRVFVDEQEAVESFASR